MLLDDELAIGSSPALDDLPVVRVLASERVDHAPVARDAHDVLGPTRKLLLERANGRVLGARRVDHLQRRLDAAHRLAAR